MTYETMLKCLACGGTILRVVEQESQPPWNEATYLVCEKCGEHHAVEDGQYALQHSRGPVVDVSDEEARAWQSRGGCRGVCGRDFPWA